MLTFAVFINKDFNQAARKYFLPGPTITQGYFSVAGRKCSRSHSRHRRASLPHRDPARALWWREGPPLTLAWKRFDLLAGPSPYRHNRIQTKEK
jgi:hypothetical protein